MSSFSYKDEFVQVMLAIAQYAANDEMQKKLHRFFEHALLYLKRPETMSSHHSWAFDNFKFIVHELFLHTMAILIRYERFEFAHRLLTTPYYVRTSANSGGEATTTFVEFRDYMESFRGRDSKLRRHSSRADLLKQRAELSRFDFKALMQADFVLYLRATLNDDNYVRWWPETLVYATHYYGPMEVFARSRSASYYAEVSKLLGGVSADDLKVHVGKLQSEGDRVPRWQFEHISPGVLAGIDKLASIP